MIDVKTLIIGVGEIGSSLYSLLSPVYPTWAWDIDPKLNKGDYLNIPNKFDVFHICIRYSDNFLDIVKGYVDKYQPQSINVCTTVPPGITEKIGPNAVHSTTRGLHPNLQEGLLKITKHIGGPQAVNFADYFSNVGITSYCHNQSRTTELLHILNNVHYGINLIFADEAAKLCRDYGVDYYDYMKYCETNNAGFSRLGHATKVRPILTPPGGRVGGHCVVQSAQLLPENSRPQLIERLARYND